MTSREWRRLGLSPFREKPPDKETKTRRCQDLEENSGRKSQGHRDAEVPVKGEAPQSPTWTWVQSKGGKGGSKPERERQQPQACGVGCRDKQQRLAGGGGGRRPGGRRFTPGEEEGSGWKFRGLQRVTATDGEEVGKRGEIMIQQTGEEKGGTEGIY